MMLGPAMMLAAAGGLALLAGGDAAIVYEGCAGTVATPGDTAQPCCADVDGLGNAFNSPSVQPHFIFSNKNIVNDYTRGCDAATPACEWAETILTATLLTSLDDASRTGIGGAFTGTAPHGVDVCGVQRTCDNYDGHNNNLPCPEGWAFDQDKATTASTAAVDISADDAVATGCCKRQTCGDIGSGVNFVCPRYSHRANMANVGSTVLSLENCCVPKTCGNYYGENQPITCYEVDLASTVTKLVAAEAANAGEGCVMVFGACSNPSHVVPASKLDYARPDGGTLTETDCCHERTCADMDGAGTPAKCYHGPINTVNNPTSTVQEWIPSPTFSISKPVTDIESISPQWLSGWLANGGVSGGCCKPVTCKDLYDDLLAPGAPHAIFTEYADAASAPGLNFLPGFGYNQKRNAACTGLDGASAPAVAADTDSHHVDPFGATATSDMAALATACTPAATGGSDSGITPDAFTFQTFNEYTCSMPQTCEKMDSSTTPATFTCPASRFYDSNTAASGILATAAPSATPPVIRAAASDVLCCTDPTCDAVDAAGTTYVCTSPLSEKAVIAGVTNPSDANCCFTPTCGDFDGAGADYDCGKDTGLAAGTDIVGYTFKAGGEATVLNGADVASNRAQCCDSMTCSSAVGTSGAALTCTGTGTQIAPASPTYTGSLSAGVFTAAQPTTAVMYGAFQLAGYVKDSAATALASLTTASTDIQAVFDTDCCKLATCGDADGAGAPYNCAIKTQLADTFASDTFFVNEASTQSNGMTFGVNSIEVSQSTCCRTKVCADSDGAGTPFACPAGFVFNTANSGTQANQANGPLDQGLCCTADAGATVATTVVTTAAVTTAAVTTAAVTTAAVTTAAATTAAPSAAVTTAAAAAAAVNVEATDVFTGGCTGFTAAQQLQAMMDLATELGLDLGTIDFAQSTFQCATARRSRRQASQTATIQFAVTGGAAAAAAAQSLVSAAASTTTAPAAKGKKAKAAKAAKMPKAAKGNKTAKAAKAAKMPKAKGNKTAKAAKAKAAKAAKGNKTAKASKAGKAAKAKAAKQMLQDQAEGGGATAASGMQTGLALLGGLLGVVGVAVGLRKRGAGGAGYAAVGDASVLEATEKSPLMATPTAYQRAPDGVEP